MKNLVKWSPRKGRASRKTFADFAEACRFFNEVSKTHDAELWARNYQGELIFIAWGNEITREKRGYA
jgi:hypothetical protein